MANVGGSLRDLPMMDVDLGDAVHAASPSTQVEDTLSLNLRDTMEQPPQASLSTLTISCNTSPPGHKLCFWLWGSSSNREFSSVTENWTHQPHPNSNSPTQQGFHSLGNLIQPLSWLCPIYPANWVQNTGGREHFSHQATSGCLRKWAGQPI